MLMTFQQEYLWETFNALRCVRVDQMGQLLMRHFEIPERLASKMDSRVRAMTRQLRYGNQDIVLDGDVLHGVKQEIQPLLMEAIDVMLEISSENPTRFRAEKKPPLLLRFFVDGGRQRLFSVLDGVALHANPGYAALLTPLAEERLILLVDSEDQDVPLQVTNKRYLAVRQSDGRHRFFEPYRNL